MNIESLGFRTNFIFSRFSGEVIDRGTYIVIRTPSNPDYHWGNYIIFNRPPVKGDFDAWRKIFEKEFPNHDKTRHYLFAWEGVAKPGDYQEFIDADYEFEPLLVLTTAKIRQPPHVNKEINIRRLHANQEWEDAIALQIKCADPKYMNDQYESFKRRQFAAYRKMSESGRGFWFGAYIGEQLVADLGVFFEGDIGRYQAVETHPDFRRLGICGTLVYEAGKSMMQEFSLKKLVMEADPDYHAARVYESVGFSRGETTYSLSWWQK